MRFKPPGKPGLKHYYRRPAMEAAEEWDSLYTGLSCPEDCLLQDMAQHYAGNLHIR